MRKILDTTTEEAPDEATDGESETIHYIDMFAGMGGFREGLTRAGNFVCMGHCEIDKYADRSYSNLGVPKVSVYL